MTPVVKTAGPPTLAEQFEALARQWKAETALLSSTSAMVAHPAYQAMIALGRGAVPLLLRDLEHEFAHWFDALRALTGEDPIPPNQSGNVSAMVAAWLTWGQSRGLI